VLLKTPPPELVSIGEAANSLGVCQSSLRAWERQGRLTATRTPGGHRRYRLSDLRHLLTPTSKETAASVDQNPIG
jgi:excisionase family DNA binding protein